MCVFVCVRAHAHACVCVPARVGVCMTGCVKNVRFLILLVLLIVIFMLFVVSDQ